MNTELQQIIRKLQRTPPVKLAGAVKTYPFRELLKIGNLIQNSILDQAIDPQQAQKLQLAYSKLQEIITKRTEAAQQLVEKFADTTPEVIALNNSVFSLVPSHDLLEDIKVAFENSPKQLHNLTRASSNVLEAINIEIQQRFYQLSPETIAIHYSAQALDSYRKLLKNLLAHIGIDSDIFKIYTTIIQNVIEGIKIYKSQISIAKTLCGKVFQTVPPSYDTVLNQYTIEELESYEKIIRPSQAILERDITERPSIIEFSNQCGQLLKALSEHLAERKMKMRKTSRVLQLSHYIEFLNPEKIPENATTSLIFCQILFEDAQRFLLTQQTHLDVALNIKSLEEAQHKVEDGLRYRQYAIGQFFKEVSSLSSEDLSVVPEKRLGDSSLLLQEVQNLIEDFIQRTPSAPPEHILKIAESFRENTKKLHEAILVSRSSPPVDLPYQPLEFEQTLPILSKFYDKELVRLIQKALTPGSSSVNARADDLLENSFFIPLDQLQEFIESFIQIANAS
jgi:hypothetical protein